MQKVSCKDRKIEKIESVCLGSVFVWEMKYSGLGMQKI